MTVLVADGALVFICVIKVYCYGGLKYSNRMNSFVYFFRRYLPLLLQLGRFCKPNLAEFAREPENVEISNEMLKDRVVNEVT